MNIVLTGATGFIGSHLLSHLLDEGHSLAIVVRESSNLELIAENAQKCSQIIYDGTIHSLNDGFKKFHADIVIHLASMFVAEHQTDQVTDLIHSNVLFGTHLLEAMSVNQVKRLINTGTAWQHFESKTYSPVCLYAATKQAFMDIAQYYHEVHKFSVLTLSLFDTYGPGDTRRKLVNLFTEYARSGEALNMSPGEQLLDIVYIDDVISAFLSALDLITSTHSPQFQEYGVTAPKRYSLKQLAELYTQVSGRVLNIFWGERAYRTREVMEPWVTPPTLPGWQAQYDWPDGLKKLL